MKKYIGVLAVILFVPFKSFATTWTEENCTNQGGTIITANKYGDDKGGLCLNPNESQNCNGKSFCMRNQKLNWWSDFTWCEFIGGTLASFDSLCPESRVQDTRTAGDCPNLTKVGNSIWIASNIGNGSGNVFVINLSSGAISGAWGRSDASNNNYGYAVCE